MASGQQGRVGALDTAAGGLVSRAPPATPDGCGTFNWCLLIWKQGICVQISRAFSGSLFPLLSCVLSAKKLLIQLILHTCKVHAQFQTLMAKLKTQAADLAGQKTNKVGHCV